MSPQPRAKRAEQDDAGASPDADAVAAGQTPPPTPADPDAAEATAGGTPLVPEGESGGREKVPVALIIRRSEEWLGIPQHVMIGALASNDAASLTLNAARKAAEKFQASVQNPDPEEEE